MKALEEALSPPQHTHVSTCISLHHSSVRKAVEAGTHGQHLEKGGEGAQLGSTGLTHQVHLLRVAPIVGNLLQHPVDAGVHILQHVHNCALHNPNYFFECL